ncbi:fimbrial protein [Pseudoxanthomonas beigongshangi]
MQRKLRAIRWLYTLVLVLAPMAPAQAQYCTYTSHPYDSAVRFGFPGNVRVPVGAPDGTVLASTVMTMSYSCPGTLSASGWSFVYRSLFTSSSTVPGDLYYSTGHMGLAIRVTNLDNGQQMKNDTSQGLVQWIPPILGTAPVSGSLNFKFELVKLNDLIYNPNPSLAAGLSLTFGEFRIVNNATSNKFRGLNIMWDNEPIKISTIPRSCSVTTGDTSVYLDKVWTSQLKSPGITAGDKAFTVGLRCSAGTNVYVTLTDLTDPGNTGNQLTLTSDSTASGVKLRLLKSNGDPVSFGPDSSAFGNRNQWFLGASATTTGIPLTAQYISTGPVKAGVVKERASFTLSYQ